MITDSATLFFIPTLEAGGAERVCILYANSLNAFHPNLVLQFLRGDLLDELNSTIPLFDLSDNSSPKKGIRAWLRVLKLKLKEILKPYKQKLGTIIKPLKIKGNLLI